MGEKNKQKNPDPKVLMDEIVPLEQQYQSTFGVHPPTFGYPNDELLEALKNSLDTKTPMRGYDEIINELNNTKVSERSGRAMDHEQEDVFEKLRTSGYM